VTATVDRTYQGGPNPFHAILLAGTIPLFLGAAISDYAYSKSYQIQWSNFASWLIAGGLVFAGLALVFAVIGLFLHADRRRGMPLINLGLMLVTWVIGFINALIHARDAWAMMPTGFILSIIVTILACAATWIGFSHHRHSTGEKP